MADELNKSSGVPEGISSLSDEKAITEIDIGSFLTEKDNGSAPYDGYREDIRKTEQSLENEIQNLMDDIMNSGPAVNVPRPAGGESPAGDFWASPSEYIDISQSKKSDAPAGAPAPEVGKDEILSMIDSLKADTDNKAEFDSILSDIEKNPKIKPVVPQAPAPEKPEKKPAGGIDIHAEGFEAELAALLGDEPVKEPEPAPAPARVSPQAPQHVSPQTPQSDGIPLRKKEPFTVNIPHEPSGAVEIAASSVSSEPPVQVFDLLAGSGGRTVGNVPVEIIEDDGKLTKEEKRRAKIDRKIAEGKNPKVGEIIRKIVLVASVITIIVSSAFLVKTYIYEPMMFKRHQSEVQKIVVQSPENNIGQTVAQEDSKYPPGMLAKYKKLYDINSDLRGWISIPGLEIDLPIAHADNNDFYLHRNIYKKRTQYGVPFFDYRIKDFKNLPRNTVIYGHNMHYDDLIFGKLEDYRYLSAFKKSPVIECNTIYGDYSWFVYAAFITNSLPSQDNGYMFTYNWLDISESKFVEYINEVNKRRFYDTGVDIATTDKILTLSTCCYDFDGARLVIIARLKRDGEGAVPDTSQAANNDNPKYPQAWYNANKKTNPYADDSRWSPNK